MKKGITALSLACVLGTFLSCQSEQEKQTQEITLTNQSAVELTDKAIAIKREQLGQVPEGDLYPVLLTQEGDTVTTQLDDLDGDKQWDELFFVMNLPANGKQALQLTWSTTQPNYTTRTSVRFGKRTSADTPVQPRTSDTLYANQLPKSAGYGYQPYQTDGPAWENDKVGFRHYLDGRNAKDVFGKRVSYMSPDTVGINSAGAVEDNYHEMREWGRDIMAVGNSAGIGGLGLMIGDSLYRLGVTVNDSLNNVEKTTFAIVAEGPVRSMMHLGYHNWRPEGTNRTYTLEEQPTIWPGMYAYRNTAKLTGLKGDEILLIGMNNLDPTDRVTEIEVDDKWVVLLTHDRETYKNEWLLGLALILPKEAYLGLTDAPVSGRLAQAHFAKMKAQENQPVTYYAVSGWEMSNEAFKDPASFRSYVQDLARQLTAEVDVAVK